MEKYVVLDIAYITANIFTYWLIAVVYTTINNQFSRRKETSQINNYDM